MNRLNWRERREQWRRFSDWEADQLRERPLDLDGCVAWFASAAELAANLHWGRPRLTEDIDVTVEVAEGSWPDFISRLSQAFRALPVDPIEFVRKTRVLPLSGPGGVRIDLIFAGLHYESEAIRRAATVRVEGKGVRVCTAEDLVLHKFVSERPRDAEDVEGVILRQASKLDRAYLDPRVHELSQALERPGIEGFYHECLAKADPAGDKT